MTKVKIGVGRFYNASACSIVGAEEIGLAFKFEGFDVSAYAGRGLKHTVMSWKFDPPVRQQFPSSDIFPADFYLELILTQWLDVADELAAAFYADDKPAREEIYKLMEQNKELYARGLNYVAGFLGLRLNKLLVNTLIQEQEYIYHENKPSYALRSNFKVTFTDSFKWDKNGAWASDMKRVVSPYLSKRKWEKPAGVFVWLLRAWAAEDIVLKFVSLLTALECVIPGLPAAETNRWMGKKEQILSLIKKNARVDEVESLTALVKELQPPSSIVTRFELWATQMTLPGWKNDISIFKRNNKLRNRLVHQGQPGVEYRVAIELKDIQALEDIAERYVSLALLGDANVYKSRRPEKEEIL